MPHQGRHGCTKCAARGSTSSWATSACKVRVECPRTGLRIGLGHMRARVEGGRELAPTFPPAPGHHQRSYVLRRLNYSTRGDIFYLSGFDWRGTPRAAVCLELADERCMSRGCEPFPARLPARVCNTLAFASDRSSEHDKTRAPGSFRLPSALLPARHLFRASSARGTV